MRPIAKQDIRRVPTPWPHEHTVSESGEYGQLLDRPPRRLAAAERYEQFGGPWDRLGTALFLAGGAYPFLVWLCLTLIATAIAFTEMLHGDFGPLVFAPAYLGASLLIALIAGCFTLFYGGFVTLFALLIVAGVVRALRLHPRWERLGSFSGSWVVFLSFLPLIYGAKLERDLPSGTWQFLALGPALAIAWGMGVGAYVGVGNQRRCSRGVVPTSQMRFSIWQIMMLTLVISAVLGLLRVAQMLNSALLFSVGFWLFCLIAFYWPATRSARWLYRRRARRYLKYRAKRRITSREAASNEPGPIQA